MHMPQALRAGKKMAQVTFLNGVNPGSKVTLLIISAILHLW